MKRFIFLRVPFSNDISNISTKLLMIKFKNLWRTCQTVPREEDFFYKILFLTYCGHTIKCVILYEWIFRKKNIYTSQSLGPKRAINTNRRLSFKGIVPIFWQRGPETQSTFLRTKLTVKIRKLGQVIDENV